MRVCRHNLTVEKLLMFVKKEELHTLIQLKCSFITCYYDKGDTFMWKEKRFSQRMISFRVSGTVLSRSRLFTSSWRGSIVTWTHTLELTALYKKKGNIFSLWIWFKQNIFTTAAIQLYPHCNPSLPSQWSKTDVTLLDDWVQVMLHYTVTIGVSRKNLYTSGG